MTDISDLLSFSSFIGKLGTTERFINKPGTEVRETLSDHCTQLALTAWHLSEANNLSYDHELLFKYALIHDIVETYTGDFPTHLPEFNRAEKEKLEHEAFNKIKVDFPDKPYLWDMLEQYEKQSDAESKFIYALDKLLPAINIYLNQGKGWEERGPEKNTWGFANVTEKVGCDEVISKLWQELHTKIVTERPELVS